MGGGGSKDGVLSSHLKYQQHGKIRLPPSCDATATDVESKTLSNENEYGVVVGAENFHPVTSA